MESRSIEERVIGIVAAELCVSRNYVVREASFVNDLGADSLDVVELISDLEEEFNITIPTEAAKNLRTVGDAIDYIRCL